MVYVVKFEFLITVLLKIQILWDLHWVVGYISANVSKGRNAFIFRV